MGVGQARGRRQEEGMAGGGWRRGGAWLERVPGGSWRCRRADGDLRQEVVVSRVFTREESTATRDSQKKH